MAQPLKYLKVRALRGVCIGVEENLVGPVRDDKGAITKPGETADVIEVDAKFLVAIGACELVDGEPQRKKAA
jgi:hypothetical protein